MNLTSFSRIASCLLLTLVGFASQSQASITVYENQVVNHDVEAKTGEQIDIKSGQFNGDIQAFNDSVINIYGGTFYQKVESFHEATINVFGGNFTVNIFDADDDTSTIKFFGSGFTVDGQDVGFGPIDRSYGTLAGTLADGNQFTIVFEQESAGRIKLCPVPEPASIAIWCAMGLAFVGTKFSHKRRR